MSDVTRVLQAIRRDEPRAADPLLPLVYDERRREPHTSLATEPPGSAGSGPVEDLLAVDEALQLLPSSRRYLDHRRKFSNTDFATTVKGFRVVREIPLPSALAAKEEQWAPWENPGLPINTMGTEWGPHLTRRAARAET